MYKTFLKCPKQKKATGNISDFIPGSGMPAEILPVAFL